MSRTLTLSVLGILVLSLIGAAAPTGTITWVMTPASPNAGDVVKFGVGAASSWPVTVEFYVDGQLVFSHTFEEAGIAEYTIPADKKGTDWWVEVESDDHTDTAIGLL